MVVEVSAPSSDHTSTGRQTLPAEVLRGEARDGDPADVTGTLAIERADTIVRRTVGLMGRRTLPEATGLLITPCSSVHTCFMRFPIDVVYLDRDQRVVKVVPALKPWRMSLGGRRAKATLELAAGEAARLGLEPGARLRISA